jgi:flagellar hook-associated protein 3 FlgL
MSFFRIGSASNFITFRQLLGMQSRRQASLSEQLATGRRVNRPSDDPAGVKIMAGIGEANKRIEQYLKNVSTADRRWRQIETNVTQINDLLNRANELAIQGNNQTLGSDQRESLAEEVAQLSQELLSISNTRINGEYIFAGFRSDTLPFSLEPGHPAANPAAAYAGDSNIKRVEISEGATVNVQLRLDDELVGTGDPTERPIFQTLANLENALRTNNIDDTDPASVGQAIEDLGVNLQTIQRMMADVGGKTNRLEKARARLEDQKVLNDEFLSQLRDIDVAEVSVEFQQATIALQATVSSAGAILNQPSLIDFIR